MKKKKVKKIKNVRFLITSEDVIYENVDLIFDERIVAIIDNHSKNKQDMQLKKNHNAEKQFNIVNSQNNFHEFEVVEEIDGSNLIIMPGFVNAHTHIAMIILRGYEDDKTLHEWLNKIWKIEDQLKPEHVYLGSKLGIMEMLMTGTLAFVDQYFFEKETAKAVNEFGIYAALGTPFVSDNKMDERLKRFYDFLDFVRPYDKIMPILNPHSIYTCDEKCFDVVKKLKEKLNLKVHIHAAETRKEVMDCFKQHKMFVIEYLDSLGLLKNSILAHCGWIKKDEIRLIKENNACVVHNASSNMKLATGAFFPLRELLNADVLICLGTDGAASNNSYNMFQEIKIASLLNKNNYWDARVIDAKTILKLAWGGWRIFGKDYKIKEGNHANFIAINIDDVSLMPLRKDNLLSNLVYSFDGSVSYAFVKGKEILNPKLRNEFIMKAKEIEKRINELFE